MKDILNWLKFLLMLLIAVGTVIFLVPRSGGTGYAGLVIFILVWFYWFPSRDRLGTRSDNSERRDEQNPLYKKQERFRKTENKKQAGLFTSELKWDFFLPDNGSYSNYSFSGLWNMVCCLWISKI